MCLYNFYRIYTGLFLKGILSRQIVSQDKCGQGSLSLKTDSQNLREKVAKNISLYTTLHRVITCKGLSQRKRRKKTFIELKAMT